MKNEDETTADHWIGTTYCEEGDIWHIFHGL